ncbi:type I 3-dehydroquinate dehydratase [Candidatus Woesearchaeota archaeon]|nr:type I 3-dehydroquinate dehydratase [Candidatus Woesearchaeota archaeon]
MAMICIPIIAPSVKEALRDIADAQRFADILELRLDYMAHPITSLVRKSRKPVIVTIRKSSEGGRNAFSDWQRFSMFREAMKAGAAFIDIEFSSLPLFKALQQEKARIGAPARFILSHHDFHKTDKAKVLGLVGKMQSFDPDVVKIAAFANSLSDNLVMLELAVSAAKGKKSLDGTKKKNMGDAGKGSRKEIIPLCMGPWGQLSRILCPMLGAFLTYGSLPGKPSAPGQIDAASLKDIFRVNKLHNPKVYGLVGNPVSQSKGFLIHNHWFAQCSLNAVYVNFLVENLSDFFHNFSPWVEGLSITIPFKQDALRHTLSIDPLAKKVGAVNTLIKRQKGKKTYWEGFNTDVAGAMGSVEDRIRLKGANALILGAGGVARAVGYGMKEKGSNIFICNRSRSKGNSFARELHGIFIPKVEHLVRYPGKMDIVANATSVGMAPQVKETPLPRNILKTITHKKSVVFDTVYSPEKTALLDDARALGLRTVSGVEMFLRQAQQQFFLWTKRMPDIDAGRKLVALNRFTMLDIRN